MQITSSLRKRFCKEAGVSILIYEEPYYSNRIELYDRILPIKEKWEVFLDALSNYKNEQDFYEDYNRVKENAIESIKSTEGFTIFSEQDMNQYRIVNTEYSSRDVYKENNDGNWFLSIDMIQANFTSMNHFDPSIFGYIDCWEDFMARFTQNKHFINSKYMRQVIMGVCNPKRQVTYEKYLMDVIMSRLIATGYSQQVKVFTNDEIVIQIESNSDHDSIIKIIDAFMKQGLRLRTTLFKLKKNLGLSGFTLHIYDHLEKEVNGTDPLSRKDIKFKMLNAIDYPFMIRYMLGEEVSEYDKVFIHEGRLAKFID